MAIAKAVVQKVDTIDERTLRTTINLPLDEAGRTIEGLRQDVSYDGDGNVIREDVLFPPVTRSVAEVADEEVDVDGTTVSLSTCLQALEAFFDRWAQENADRAVEDKAKLAQAEAGENVSGMPSAVDRLAASAQNAELLQESAGQTKSAKRKG